MILQALCDYYHRQAANGGTIAPEGFEWKEIPFLVVLDSKGAFVNLEDTREGEGKKKRAKAFLVPQAEKRSRNIKANLLWDIPEYTLGANPRARSDAPRRHGEFIDKIRTTFGKLVEIQPLSSLLAFLEAGPLDQIEALQSCAPLWKEALETNANLTFRLEGSPHPTICDAMHEALENLNSPLRGDGNGLCLITGKHDSIPFTHPFIQGVRGAQPSGAALVSFNLASFKSYGKSQNHNAPIGKKATFAYTTALTHLLSRDSNNKVLVGDATAVFWSEAKSILEDHFTALFAMPPKDNPDLDVKAVQALYESMRTGARPASPATRFFVLGLAPNAARLSVRFWSQGTIAEFSTRICQHFDDLDIARSPKDAGRFALGYLLADIALENKLDNIPPNLGGNTVQAILTGTPYPASLLQQAMRRIRATQEITRIRASLLKACLNRSLRFHPSSQKEITVALDPTNLSPGYRLGRLFAVLEKIQEDAQPGINATIRDRYYGAASTSPASVFPLLLKLKNHHLAKLDNPAFRGAQEKRLGEIFDGLADIPAHLPMEDQARFAIGYYHQRQALFTKTVKAEASTPA